MIVPDRETWPTGFATDYVTAFPDAVSRWRPGRWPWQWFRWRMVDLRPAAWRHDLRYWAGWPIPEDLIQRDSHRALTPLPDRFRTDAKRLVIDNMFLHDLRACDAGDALSDAMYLAVRTFGKDHYERRDAGGAWKWASTIAAT